MPHVHTDFVMARLILRSEAKLLAIDFESSMLAYEPHCDLCGFAKPQTSDRHPRLARLWKNVRATRCSVFTSRRVHDIRGCLHAKCIKTHLRLCENLAKWLPTQGSCIHSCHSRHRCLSYRSRQVAEDEDDACDPEIVQ